MKYSIVLSFSMLVLFNSIGKAQDKPVISFFETLFDFGEIKEDNGSVIHEFKFKNDGKSPLILTSVKASCGCTTPNWTREPVLPGQEGIITAKYNPTNRPGAFNKSLTIVHNGESGSSRIYIKGKVLARIKSIEERLPFILGNTRLKSRNINFGRITDQKAIVKQFDIYNLGQDTLRFKEEILGPDYIAMTFPEQVAPDQTEKITMVYDPKKKGELGYYNDGLVFYTSEETKNAKSINVMATISEYFPPMSKDERANAPALLIQERMQDIGKIEGDELATTSFILSNNGRRPLIIRKVESNCTCVKARAEREILEPDESTLLKVVFNAKGRRGRQTKSISIYSNDPNDPTQVVTVMTSIVPSN